MLSGNSAEDYASESTHGYLVPIGGAEDKTAERMVLNRFVQLSGNSHSHIVVIPAASTLPLESGERYSRVFKELHASEVDCLHVDHREQANDPSCVEILNDATGIFMTGGDQVRLVSLLGGTLLSRKLHERFSAGATIGGTSAGASAISQHMIAFGRSGATPLQRMVHLAPGLGLTEKVIIDQHFRQRDRIGRLMTAVSFNPAELGVGVDEDTAFIIGPDGDCEVVGSGGVTIVDGDKLSHSDIHSVKRYGPIATLGMQVHILTHGYRYNLRTRQPHRPR